MWLHSTLSCPYIMMFIKSCVQTCRCMWVYVHACTLFHCWSTSCSHIILTIIIVMQYNYVLPVCYNNRDENWWPILGLLCACVFWPYNMGCTYIPTNALGPIPTGVAVSPNGCQSLQVTWNPLTVTSPLTLNHYRVRYQAQGGSQQTATTTSQGSYTLTGLAPATTYTVIVDAQTQLGYGYHCCEPNATTGKASSDACAWGHKVTVAPW